MQVKRLQVACSRVETFEDDAKIAVRDSAFSDRVQVHAFTDAHEERKETPGVDPLAKSWRA